MEAAAPATAGEDIVAAEIEHRPCFILDPATGALVLRPDLESVVEKALRRAARRLALRLYLSLVPLYFLKLRLECRSALLRLQRQALRFFQ